MEGGEDFRDSIVDAVDSCKVFLPLINTAWATSAEVSADKGTLSTDACVHSVKLSLTMPIVRI